MATELFPFRREFIDLARAWQNAVNLDLTVPKVVRPTERWRSLPRNVKWEFQGKTVVFITTNDAYERVNILTDYFSEEARIMPSLTDFYTKNYQAVVTKANELLQKEPARPFRYYLREALRLLTDEPLPFEITAAKAILKYFRSRKVLDPSAEWGSRMLGAAAAKVEVYHGITSKDSMREPFEQIRSSLNLDRNYVSLIGDFLKVRVDDEAYDTIFTDMSSKDILSKAWRALAGGGYFILIVPEGSTPENVWTVLRLVNQELKGIYLGVIGLSDEHLTQIRPILVWRKNIS